MIHNSRGVQRMRISCSCIYLTLFLGAMLNVRFRLSNCKDLAKRKRDWELGWTALGVMQIRESREGRGRDKDTATQELSDAAMLFRKRAFHHFFIRLAAGMAPSEMTF